MRQSLHIGLTVSGVVLAMAAGQAIPRAYTDRMPQVAGEDVLAMVLGDVRQILGAAMLDKAEEYFHGGVRDVACERGLGGAHAEHGHEEGGKELSAVPDAWAWLNGKVHVQEDRHIEGESSRELLPWLWAACRVSPQNVQAYESSAFVLESMAKRPHEAVRLLEEGIGKNPASASLEFSLGELLLRSFHEPARAERAFAAAREKCRPADGPEGEKDKLLKVRALFYLGYLAKQRGDLGRAREYLAEAESLDPQNAGTRDLRKFLERK